MKKIFISLLVFFAGTWLQAQNKQYDIFSYSTPAGFKLKEQKQRLLYEKRDGNSFCQIHIWPAQQGSSDPAANFKTDWEHFAVKPYSLTEPPTTQTEKQNGWEVVTGASPAAMDGIPFIVAVSTFTQNDISWCAVSIFNDEKYAAAIDKFLLGIKADSRKLVRKPNQTNQQNNIPTANNNTNGITKSTTNFDDGWTATPATDYVRVTKAGTEVRLYFVNAAIDQQRPSNTNTFEPYYWKTVVQQSFNSSQPIVREKEAYSYGKGDIWEANITDKQTGQSGYLGMRLLFNNGACLPIVVIARDKNTYYSLFGKDEDFTRMMGYNKFAVTQNDLIGHWKSFDAASISYYSVYSGDYAGMSTASTNDDFTFNINGSYQSVHTGTSVFRGSVAHGKTTYKGNYNVNNWNFTAANRGANDPGEFTCQLEAIKGGYLLRLQNKKFTGETMYLFKAKK